MDETLVILAGYIGALAYLNKLSYLYIPIALISAIVVKLVFDRTDRRRSAWLVCLFIVSFIFAVLVAGVFIIGWQAFRDVLVFTSRSSSAPDSMARRSKSGQWICGVECSDGHSGQSVLRHCHRAARRHRPRDRRPRHGIQEAPASSGCRNQHRRGGCGLFFGSGRIEALKRALYGRGFRNSACLRRRRLSLVESLGLAD